jgi:putative exosortase-associated protein (TIGR04073 family)
MQRIRLLPVAVVVGVICLCTNLSHAGSSPFKTPENSPPQEVVEGMTLKFARGISNAALGWLELPKQVYTTYRNEGPAMGIAVGPLKGIGMMLLRTISGAAEVATFPAPFPGFYDPYFEPPFVWQKEEAEPPGN